MTGSDRNCASVGRKEVNFGRITWMNEENDWDHNVEGPVVCVRREEVIQVLNEIKTRKATGPSDISLELIGAREGVEILVMAEICQSKMDLECQLNGH